LSIDFSQLGSFVILEHQVSLVLRNDDSKSANPFTPPQPATACHYLVGDGLSDGV
jgi:hypothetical protein